MSILVAEPKKNSQADTERSHPGCLLTLTIGFILLTWSQLLFDPNSSAIPIFILITVCMMPIALMLFAAIQVKRSNTPENTVRKIERGEAFQIAEDGEILFIDEPETIFSSLSTPAERNHSDSG